MPKPTPVQGLGPKSTQSEAAARLVQARLRDLRGHLGGAAGGKVPDEVHDLRVCCRRLRVALELFGAAELAGQVKELQDALGAVRDLHVQSKWLHGTNLPRLIAEREAHLQARADELDRALHNSRSRTAPLVEKARRRLGAAEKLKGKAMRKALLAQLGKLGQRLPAARSAAPPEAHRLRIAVKKLRYLLELLEPAFADAARAGLEELEHLQDALGELHDADARLVVLRAFLEGASEEELEPALAALALLLAERDELASVARSEIRRWRKKGLVRVVRDQV